MTAHPAKFSSSVLTVLRPLVEGRWRVLDPFAGTGAVLDLNPDSVGIEIEPEWAAMHPRCIVGDATALPFPERSFSCVVTSPAYGNRMADHHDAKDGSRRHTYRHTLGRPLHENSSGKLQWGKAYRELHVKAWAEAHRVLVPFGVFILNISDHIRKGEVVEVERWHCETLEALNFVEIDRMVVATPRLRDGENADARVAHESVIVFLRRSDYSRA